MAPSSPPRPRAVQVGDFPPSPGSPRTTSTYEEESADDDAESQVDPGDVAADPLKENPFDSEGSRILFDAMDQLQSCIRGSDDMEIDIPQLVIVGGQSTGKSSLLQSMTDIPFPADSGCCTRFATRIVSRRTPAGTPNRYKITIADPEVRVGAFQYPDVPDCRDFVRIGETLTAKEFLEAMDQASKEYMGISSGKGPGKKNFATQVLKVELSGPSRSHFSILDVPGVFSSAHAVNENEMEGVKQMVIEYMKKPENIVICVADAVTDLANQGTFTLAAQHVEKKRLVSVFTKCDLQPNPGEVVDIATGRQEYTAHSLGKECFVVRNRSSQDNDDEDLADLEARIFNKAPWTEIPASRRGSTMLRQYLSHLLCDKISEKFPVIQHRIGQRLVSARQARHLLGNARHTLEEKKRYLAEVAQAYQDMTTKALKEPAFLPEHIRLRDKVRRANDEFASDMLIEGHTFEFENPDKDAMVMLAERTAELRAVAPTDPFVFGSATPPPAFTLQPPMDIKTATTPPTTPNHGAKKTTSARGGPSRTKSAAEPIFKHIEETAHMFQISLLPGLINFDVLPLLFQHQTQQWPVLADRHLKTVAEHVAQTVISVLDRVCPVDGGTKILRAELSVIISQAHANAAADAEAEVATYCRRERESILQTTDARFLERLKALRTVRLLESLGSLGAGLHDPALYFNRLHYSMDDNMVKDVHDVLKVYYQIAIEGFNRHITHNIIEEFVNAPQGPLRILSKDWVYDLDAAVVEQFAREDDETVARREEADELVSKLQTAQQIGATAMARIARLGTA